MVKKTKKLVIKKSQSEPVFKRLHPRHVVLFLFISLFILFYPGQSIYTDLFFNNRPLIAAESSISPYSPDSISYVVNPSYIPDISASGVYIIDLSSASPLYEKNVHSRYLPASTTKVITALAASDHFDLDDVLIVREVIDEGQVVGLVSGEKLTFENLLYGLLVHSGNDAAYVIADNYPGGRQAFVAKMNEKARMLHMISSQFKNPAGLDEFGQYTTPFDLSLAGRALLLNKTLAKIVSIKSITISDIDFIRFHPLANVNRLLGEIPGIGGLKTGYTIDAGENLMTFYKKNQHQFLIIILRSDDRFTDTARIVSWINSNVAYIKIGDTL